MIKLITNSDDFGLTDSITDAIIDTHLNGIMTSTTMMANMEGFDYAVKKAKEIKTLGVGIHFNLTEGRPLSSVNQIPDLLDEKGIFLNNRIQRKNLLLGKYKQLQAEIELKNQLVRLLDNGITPTHFDSHHHITGVPCSFRASMNIALKHGLKKARITNIDRIYSKDAITPFYKKALVNLKESPKKIIHYSNKYLLRKNGFVTPDTKILPGRVLPNEYNNKPIKQFLRVLDILQHGVTEISFHPGYDNSDPNDSEKTANIRLRDLLIATSPEIIKHIKRNNIKLISFKDL